jgi:hypothetical protein
VTFDYTEALARETEASFELEQQKLIRAKSK